MDHDVIRFFLLFLGAVLARGSAGLGADVPPLYQAQALTPEGSFTSGIEGPACDREGRIYAVNYQRQGTIGRCLPTGEAEVFLQLPGDSIGNGIRFDRAGTMFIADYVQHNVLRVAPGSREVQVFVHHEEMHQPNDLAITASGELYASDPDWGANSGQIWHIAGSGVVRRVAGDMGTTNGIEVSPDGRSLYVNESVQRHVWSFRIAADGSLTDKRLVRTFPDHGFDGMRCDVDGNLYITRHGKGTVIKMQPDGTVLQEIDVLGKYPSNICFGGVDGCTAYVTEVEHRRLVQFRVERPGLEWQRLHADEK